MEVKNCKDTNNCKNGSSKLVKEEGIKEEENMKILKRRILGHPLYPLLVKTHTDCLKVGLGEITNVDGNNRAKFKLETPSKGSSDLDVFMEAYCITLIQLKVAMEEPFKETASFIEAMNNQLNEINRDNHQP